MVTTIHPRRLNHMNMVLRDAEEGIRHFREKYDAELVADIPKPSYHAFLFATGGVLFEAFTPGEYLLNARYGPHYVGVEFQADMDVVGRAIAERGMRIVREARHARDLAGNPGHALHTHPADGFGVAYEFYHDDFHTWNWPAIGGRITPSDAWLSHPLGLTGQKGYTHAVADIEAARDFLESFLGAKTLYDVDRPAIGGRAIGLRIADVVVDLLTPTSEGQLDRHLRRYGDGIRSTVFGVRDIDQAQRFLTERGLSIVPGSAPGTIAVAPEDNLGVIFEFAA